MQLEETIQKAYKRLLQMHFETNTGHIGANLSVLEIIITLFHSVFHEDDRFILSKGHAAGALYIALWSIGLLSEEDIKTFCSNGSCLAGHPHPFQTTKLFSKQLSSKICFPTGSLGHGPSLSCGLALAAKQQTSMRHIWCVCGDGEWQEGSCWEALIFAVHNNLDNLTIIIDQNHLQGFGTTEQVASFSDFTSKITAFGACAITIDGHNPDAFIQATKLQTNGKPKVVLAHTIKGKSLKNEGTVACHYLPLTEEEYNRL